MKRLTSLFVTMALTLALTGAFTARPAAAGPAAAEDVSVTGCLIKASGDDDALLVTTLARVEAPPYTADGRAAERRAPTYMRVVYWLDGDHDDLDGHQGRIVEIRGELEGDIDRGEIKLERGDGRVDVEFKADGDRRLKARLPLMPAAAVGTSGRDAREDSSEYDVIVRKLDVREVRMLAPTCEGPVR